MAATSPATDNRTDTSRIPKKPVPWNVVLLDDDDHSYDYVIRMMQELFSYSQEKAYQIACTVDSDKRVVCLTTHKEKAEFKRDQILAFGKDPLMARSKGSMTAIIEPAEFDDDDHDDRAGGDHA